MIVMQMRCWIIDSNVKKQSSEPVLQGNIFPNPHPSVSDLCCLYDRIKELTHAGAVTTIHVTLISLPLRERPRQASNKFDIWRRASNGL